jgi:hypothetical protein
VIRLLLDAKADANSPGCASVLTAALVNNRLDALNMLIVAGASLEAACAGDPSLLLGAATIRRADKHMQDKFTILNMLMDAGAKTRPYSGGRTILHEVLLVTFPFRVTILSALLNVFLARDPGLLEARDDKGNAPLLFIFADGNFDRYHVFGKAEALLDAGADPTVCDAMGETVLMKVMRYNSDYPRNQLISEVIKGILSRTLPVSLSTARVDIHVEAGSDESSPRDSRRKRRRT